MNCLMRRVFHYVLSAFATVIVASSGSMALAQVVPSIAPKLQTQSVTIHLDPSATQIGWTLTDVLHTVHGTFALKGGLITFDPTTGAAQGEIIVETDSGESGDGVRDRRMKKDILESGKYPEAIFHPEKVIGVLSNGQEQIVTVTGTFTIHGTDHPLTLQVRATLAGNVLHAITSFEIPYVAWGMKDPSTLMLRVGKDVKVDVDAKGSVDQLPGK